MKNLIKKQREFLLAAGLLWLSLASAHFFFSNDQLFLSLHNLGQDVFDPIFAFGTYLGDGWFAFPVFLFMLLFRSTSKATAFALSIGLASGVTQVLKRSVFYTYDRPLKKLGEEMVRIIEGVDLNTLYSFPSGHTTAAFTICFALSVLTENSWMKILLALFAWFIAFTRVYLGQHFPVDLLGGAAVALAVSLLIFVWERKWTRLPDRGLIQRKQL